MDTSDTYIKMCDCPEIQGFRSPGQYYEDGDWLGNEFEGQYYPRVTVDCGCDSVSHAERCHRDELWLPRQDQLQEMVIEYQGWRHAIGDLHKLLLNLAFREEEFEATSYEQLWLAFLMRERHQKAWNGSEWVSWSEGTKVTFSKSGETSRWKADG